MTDEVSIVNKALQSFGSRTTIDATQLATNANNECIQANLALHDTRKRLLRLAPWDCGLVFKNMVVITSAPGTPENQAPAPNGWVRGLPAPPWAYEYQYPVDCLRACYVVAQLQTGLANAVPIYGNVMTGFWPSVYAQPAIRFKTATDLFHPVNSATVASGGVGYAVGDIITLASTPQGVQPIGAPAQLRVLTAPAGVVATVEVVNQVLDANPVQGGSYFAVQANPVAQGSTSGVGVGATFNLTFGDEASQRVILTNQEFATLAFVRDNTDLNSLDPLFQEAWEFVLGSKIVMGLTGDKALANMCIKLANANIELARSVDGNEGLSINDRIPDWLRVRGVAQEGAAGGPGYGFDWGGLWPTV